MVLRSASLLLSFVAEWISGDRMQQISWFPTISANAVIHNVGLQKQETLTETLDQAEWGTLYYAMKNDVS